MKVRTFVSISLSVFFAASAAIAAAQDSALPPPPKVLVIQREYLKPGKAGNVHVESEANFIKAENDAKWPTHYIAMDSMSGPTRALFMFAYDSFEAYGKDQEAQNANASLAAAIDAASLNDGELLTRYDSNTMVYQPDMSLHDRVDVPHQRYWEFTVFRIKQGHEKDWHDLVKIYTDGFANMPDRHWAVYQSQYGEDNGNEYVVINPMRTLAEVDKGMTSGDSFMAAQGPDGMKRIEELASACIESSQSNLFVVNAKESYTDPAWATAAPEIYGQPQ
ncbi:MAG TPA: hypothetical protein VL990_06465 [Acidobacteriaceae bacterium]|nr:hypothetical protein [Acidobacteriaceae bacterium]